MRSFSETEFSYSQFCHRHYESFRAELNCLSVDRVGILPEQGIEASQSHSERTGEENSLQQQDFLLILPSFMVP